MGRISIDVPESLISSAKSRAAQEGFETVEAYLAALLESELATSDEKLEELLLQRLDDPRPSIDATEGFWRDLQASVRAELDRNGRAAS